MSICLFPDVFFIKKRSVFLPALHIGNGFLPFCCQGCRFAVLDYVVARDG
ncbi:hypothetical protein ACFFW8_13165 [Erwinia tracheiphila]